MDSILTSIKKMLGIVEDYEHFDQDIIIHINSAFFNLKQLGVGPPEGYAITDKSNTWSEFIPTEDKLRFEAVKSYIYLKVKKIFDPPLNSSILESINTQINEYEWRLNVAAEQPREEELDGQ